MLLIKLLLLCGVSTYHIGNSLTFDSLGRGLDGVYSMERVYDAYGYDYTLGLHVDSNTTMKMQWDNPNGELTNGVDFTKGGNYTTALANGGWDALTLQPFAGTGSTLGQDVEAIQNFRALAPYARHYIYQTWPRQSDGNYTTYWENMSTNFTLSSPTAHSRNYYKSLRNSLDSETLFEIPTGEVRNNINKAIESGDITEITANDMYRDNTHASWIIGRYVATMTVFSTIERKDINGFIPPEESFPSDILTPAIYTKLNKIIWDTVSTYPFAAISDWNYDGYVDNVDLDIIFDQYGLKTDGKDILLWQRNFRPREMQQAFTQQIPEPSCWIFMLPLLVSRHFRKK